MSLTKKPLLDEDPQWVAVRLQNALVWQAIDWSPGPAIWRQAANEAFYQLTPIAQLALRDGFQNNQVREQRDPRFLVFLHARESAFSDSPTHEGREA